MRMFLFPVVSWELRLFEFLLGAAVTCVSGDAAKAEIDVCGGGTTVVVAASIRSSTDSAAVGRCAATLGERRGPRSLMVDGLGCGPVVVAAA